MKNLLMIAPYFVPRRRVGALRPFKFASHLAEKDWTISVATIKSNDLPTDEEREYLQQLNILEIKPPFDHTQASGKDSGYTGDGSSSNMKPNLIEKTGASFDRHTPLDTWIYLFRLRYGKIKAFAENQNPDILWATGDPWSGLWLGEKLSGDLNIPFIADFRDPWTLSGLNIRKRSYWSETIDRRFEKKILNHAKKVVFTSRKTAELYRKHYNLPIEKTKVIYNSYSDLFKNENTHSFDTYNFDKDRFHILFLGRFRRLSPAASILNVLQYLFDRDTDDTGEIMIHSFGDIWEEDLHRIRKMGMEKQFRIHSPVNPQQIQQVLEKADLLLVSTAPERDTIIPAKLWDYLSVEKPVLAIAPNEEIGVILEKTGGGAFFRPDQVADISDFISQMMLSKKVRSEFPVPDINRAERKKFGSAETADQLNRILVEVMAHGGD